MRKALSRNNRCQGGVESEEQSFCYFDWQHPSSAIDDLDDDEEDTQ